METLTLSFPPYLSSRLVLSTKNYQHVICRKFLKLPPIVKWVELLPKFIHCIPDDHYHDQQQKQQRVPDCQRSWLVKAKGWRSNCMESETRYTFINNSCWFHYYMLVTNNNCCLTISLLSSPKSKFNCTMAIKSDHIFTNLADGTFKTVIHITKNDDVK